MARVIVPAGIEIVVQARQLGTIRLNVLHASANAATPTAAELATAADTVRDGYASHYELYTTALMFEKVTATDISALGGQSHVSVFNAPASGTNNSGATPSNVSAVVSINSTHGGRRGHGRVYMFGLCLNELFDGDSLTPGYRGLCIALLRDINTGMTAAGLPMVIFSRANIALYPWQGVSMDTTVDSQRRRLLGRGR